jgi:hypothetical protein
VVPSCSVTKFPKNIVLMKVIEAKRSAEKGREG